MPKKYDPLSNFQETPSTPPLDRIDRKANRLKTLLDLGGTLENKGDTLHIHGLRIDVAGLTEMDKTVWREVRRSIEELMEFDSANKGEMNR
ncbi:MAG: hypothetical protein LKM36_08180 [Flavobacteriales bacterium]|jgi:hypothetical protein|nr:hypothetical protein [Flavobacteriales bacterium]